jgi:D-proline reductase (dithiol) PrdB
MIPELTASVGVPRIAAIEHPFGQTLGSPGDAARQLEVLRATLRALEEISQPGSVVNLPFEWDSGDKVNVYPPEPPPIVRYIRRNPWHFLSFLRRTPPQIPAFPGGEAG